MSANFVWSITKMGTWPSYEGETDVVVWAQWDCTGTEVVNGSTFTANNAGTAFFTLQQGSSFTPYDQLTQDQVLGWCWQSVSKADVQIGIQDQINTLATPTPADLPLPWVPPVDTSQQMATVPPPAPVDPMPTPQA